MLDAQIAERYSDVMLDRRNSAAMKAATRRVQLAFLTQRERCGADGRCLEEIMHLRLAEFGQER